MARLILLPHRAAYWPAARTLLAADLHVGKDEAFRAAGLPMPGGPLDHDLDRLEDAARVTGAERVLVLGDLLHAGEGLTPSVIDAVAAWRARVTIDIHVVPGNHDRRLGTVADAWRLRVLDALHREGAPGEALAFSHVPRAVPGAFTLAGHIHPLASIRGPGDELRLPCFWIADRFAVLPAFSVFTGGVTVEPGPGDRLFAVVPDSRRPAVVEVTRPPMASRAGSSR